MIDKFLFIEQHRQQLELAIFVEVFKKVESHEIILQAEMAAGSPLAWCAEVMTFIQEAVDLHIVNEQRSDLQ